MTSPLNPTTLHLIERRLHRGPWAEGVWDARGRRVGGAFLRALLREMESHPAMVAVARAADEAREESPTTSAAWHEAWCRVTLVWCVREITRAAHESADPATRLVLSQQANQLAAAEARLAQVDANAPESFESLVEASREAFALARDGGDPSAPEHAVLAMLHQQLRHTASLLVVGGHSIDNLLRGALARTDRAARREDLSAWSLSPLARRQALAQRGLLDAAWALAAHVPSLAAKDLSTRDSALWFARTACRLASRVQRVTDWVPVVPEDSARTLPESAPRIPPREAPAAARVTPVVTPEAKPTQAPRTERAMEPNKLTPVLKTLENDAGDAAWRLAGSQFVKLAKEPLVALLSRQLSPGDESFRARLAAFLDTEVGASILASLLSVGLSALPLPNQDVTQRLSRELRVRAMAGAGDVLADVLMGPLRQVAVMYLQGVPGASPAASADPVALPANQVIDALRAAAAGTVAESVPAEGHTTT